MEKYYIDFIKSKTKDTIVDIEQYIEENKEEFEDFVEKKEKILKRKRKVRELNNQRDKELKGFVIDSIFMNEDVIKTMTVAYNIATDNETIQWIDVNNQVVDFSKADFGALIKQGSTKVKEIYFRYRKLKDELLGKK